MFSFAITSGLASDYDKFKMIIMLHWVHKFGPHHHHLFLKCPFFHAKLGLDVCPKSSPSTYL